MNNLTTKSLLAAAAFVVAGTVNAQQAQDSIVVESTDSPLYLRTDGLPEYLAVRLEEKAREGFRSLNQYVIRTRMIHQLDINAILVTREAANVAMAKGEKVHLVLVAKDD